MTRIYLGGKGVPLPILALPDPSQATDLPPYRIDLPPGAPFEKGDYVGLGYTNFEVWCVGARGGNGGGIESSVGNNLGLGGGGGGGGLHYVAGLLAELPDSCPIVIGTRGADGAPGSEYSEYKLKTGPDGMVIVPNEYILDTRYVAPTPGSPGGYSSFNGDTCRASGGMGGLATPHWNGLPDHQPWAKLSNLRKLPGGLGGQGGKGDRATPGGGAEGASYSIIYHPAGGGSDGWDVDRYVLIPASDGVWNGIVGHGGGGGIGGRHFRSYIALGITISAHLAASSTRGGQGSFSFADTSVYGPREPLQYVLADSGWSPTYHGRPLVAGGGGGARLGKTAIYGGQGVGANPNGAVVIRLTKVV